MVGLSDSVYANFNCLFSCEVGGISNSAPIISTDIILPLSFTAVVDLKGFVETASHFLVVFSRMVPLCNLYFVTIRPGCF